jgi:hypothetical protein
MIETAETSSTEVTTVLIALRLRHLILGNDSENKASRIVYRLVCPAKLQQEKTETGLA